MPSNVIYHNAKNQKPLKSSFGENGQKTWFSTLIPKLKFRLCYFFVLVNSNFIQNLWKNLWAVSEIQSTLSNSNSQGDFEICSNYKKFELYEFLQRVFAPGDRAKQFELV